MPPRPEKVDELVRVALEAFVSCPDHTADELVSATYTLCNKITAAVIEMGGDKKVFREGLERIMLLCADDKVVN
jgi:hypothetical protein